MPKLGISEPNEAFENEISCYEGCNISQPIPSDADRFTESDKEWAQIMKVISYWH